MTNENVVEEVNDELAQASQAMMGESLPFMVAVMMRVEKLRVSTQVRRSHLLRRGVIDPQTDRVWGTLMGMEMWLDRDISALVEDHPAYPWFSRVKGVGTENIAKVIGLIDIERCPHVSSLWQFAGYGKDAICIKCKSVISKPAGKESDLEVRRTWCPKCKEHKDVNDTSQVFKETQRKRANEKLTYNSQLRTMCWRLGGSLMKAKGRYYTYYMEEKGKYIEKYTNQGYKIVPAAQLPTEKKEGRSVKVEKDGYISEGHIHAMALRKMIKLFLSHLWTTWRANMGLPVGQPYVHEKLGHTHYCDPEEFAEKKAS